jgi:hypothetical protein
VKTKTLITYLTLPALFTVIVFISGELAKHKISAELLFSGLVLAYLFYAAPYILWAGIVAAMRVSNITAHTGFIAVTVSLLVIASAWLFPGDPSGLPLQWMLYWPLALLLLFVAATGAGLYFKFIAPDTSHSTDA